MEGMKLFAYRKDGRRHLGLLRDGRHEDLEGALARRGLDEDAFLERVFAGKASFEALLREAGPLPQIPAPSDFDIPIARPSKVLAIGKNFAAHAAEFGAEVPKEPIFFAKGPSALLPHGEPVRIPYWLTTRVDHEAEIALIVGRRGKHIPAARAWEHVGGYTVLNDITARKMQGDDRREGHPWLRSKSLDTSAPCGPYWVPAAFLPDPASCRIECRVNGELRQKGKGGDMVHPIPKVLSYVSRHMTIEPGDILSLGTPGGVGPLLPGDVVECEVSGIGVLRNPVEREKLPREFEPPPDKEALFAELRPRIEKILGACKNSREMRRKAVDLLHASLPHFHWTGIYLLEGNTLVLGPYHGKPTEHTRIPVGRGICGRAVAEKRPIVIEDVARESNYLACSLETRSEIVVPIHAAGEIVGEIDVDSEAPAAFDRRDQVFLEGVASLLGSINP